MRWVKLSLTLMGVACTFSPHARGAAVDLTALTSTGSLGDFAAYLITHTAYGTGFFLNTDSGSLIAGGYNPSFGILGNQVGQFTPQSLAQPGGPTLSVFNFSAFDLPQGYGLTLYGNAPAVILSQASMQIAGGVQVWSNAGQGGTGGSSFFSSTPATAGGGPGGGGPGGNGSGYQGPDQYGTGGSGGGGGMVSVGGAGIPGANFGGQAPGGYGGAQANLSIFAGGGGGGGGGGCYGNCYDSGRHGGNGGGAAFFGTPFDFTITATGGIYADGQNGPAKASSDGAAGGGAGGYLWFGVTGTWTNSGVVSAHGGSGGSGTNGGSGGYINIDPTQIINNGLIDVADGAGGKSGLVNLDSPLVTGSGNIEGSLAPEPGTFLLAAISVGALLLRRRKHAAMTNNR